MSPDLLSDADFAAWFNVAPSQRQVEDYEHAATKRQAQKDRAEAIRQFRARWPSATASDKVIGWLVDIEQSVGRA